jgi:uncharacterized membrane protein/membrane-bound inhibitor of C-type lysozyme
MKRLTVWAAAVAVIVVAVQLLTRQRPDAAVGAVAVLEQAPVSLPTTPGATVAELQRPAREPVRETGARAAPALVASADTAPARDDSRRFMFDCGNGLLFAVRTDAGEATVFAPEALGAEVIALPQVEAASGTRYAQGGWEFWSRGGLASFQIRDRTFADCTSNPGAAATAETQRRDLTLRATGNEPSWLLEIAPAEITLTTELGQRRIVFPPREPTVAGARTTYRSFAGTQDLVVTIDRTPCNDTMSGELFDNSVAVTFDGTTLYGCGRIP